ncbi:MAG TPA: DUF5615 family PIN-like protein [Ktedonobacteraceae bacterium]|nr:DUF5615 family PIN-like protein [Ktedonobacteraceae bacterium]
MSLPASSSSPWRFFVDENLTHLLAPRLLAEGYFADDVRDVGLQKHPDSDIWAYTQAHSEVLITKDKDFADIRAYPPPHPGIVIVDVPDVLTVATLVQLIIGGLASLAGQSLTNAVVTISPGRVRVRR